MASQEEIKCLTSKLLANIEEHLEEDERPAVAMTLLAYTAIYAYHEAEDKEAWLEEFFSGFRKYFTESMQELEEIINEDE